MSEFYDLSAGRQRLRPPGRDVIDPDAAFGQEFLDVPVRQGEGQIPLTASNKALCGLGKALKTTFLRLLADCNCDSWHNA